MIGATIGQRYRLLRLLGQGGMGCVYEAEHVETSERVAVKVLHGHLCDAQGLGSVRTPGVARERFRREAGAANAIGGPHVARVLEVGACDETGRLYLASEQLDGEDLQRLLDRVGPLAPESALRVAWQALEGLVRAHAAGVVHRDVKPANLFLARGPDGAITVKILDFGIAKVAGGALGGPGAASLTGTGSILGSPLYMAPEQIQNSRDVDGRADLWSLGCVLFAAIAGRAPHGHLETVGQILLATCGTPAPLLADVVPWVRPELSGVVRRALAIDRTHRYATASAMLDAVSHLVRSGELTEAELVGSGEVARPAAARVVVASESGELLRGDEATVGADAARPVRSGVPLLGRAEGTAAGRLIVVDPRRVLGDTSELWSFSLDVHRTLASLVARIYRSLRRAGAALAPMTFGARWGLVEARTGRALHGADAATATSLEAAGVEPGSVLWVVRLDEDASSADGRGADDDGRTRVMRSRR